MSVERDDEIDCTLISRWKKNGNRSGNIVAINTPGKNIAEAGQCPIRIT